MGFCNRQVSSRPETNIIRQCFSGAGHKVGDVNKDYFTQVDIRTTKEIKLYSKDADILTTHPTGSYALEKDDKDQLTLKITNPKEFWSVSKYLVIQVK